jgi:peptide/nickel transport system substrate-binding protein
MTKYRRLALFGAVVGAGALVLAACSSGSSGGSNTASNPSSFNGAVNGIENPSSHNGGTLNLSAGGDCDSWDPARTYYAFCWDLQRLFTRTLMGYPRAAGSASLKTAPDMATAPGAVSNGGKTWTYHLKSGLEWQDGTPITTADIKYGIERLYATSVINGGPNFYYLCLLDTCDSQGNPEYKGPYADPSGQLTSIQTPNATTIVFNLQHAYGDFDYLMTLPASAPVPKAHDTGATYSQHVWSSGPFEFQSYTPGKSVVWVRNPHWKQSTDTIRQVHVDQVNLQVITDPSAADAALKAGTIDLESDGGVQAAFQAQIVSDPSLKKYADNPVTGFTRYLVVAQTVPPLNNVHCRMAVFYAINKSDLLTARGGTYGGNIANVMTPPNVPGYDATSNPYPVGSDNTGDLTKAKSELAACGHPNGFTTNMAYVAQGKGITVFEATQQALARVGIKVNSAPGSQSSYYSTYIGSPATIVSKGLGIMEAGWGADFPTGNGFWNSISSGQAILPVGNTNYPSINDPTINNLLSQGQQITTGATSSQAENTYKQLDARIMQLAVYLPYVFDKSLYYHNPRLTNLYLNAGIGNYYDYVNVGIS